MTVFGNGQSATADETDKEPTVGTGFDSRHESLVQAWRL